jgi:predicted TIM-barrel fold metal-dependent hydrolase
MTELHTPAGPVIDVQAHWFPPSYIEALRAVADGSGRAAEIATRALNDPLRKKEPIFTGAIDRRLELMDAAGVDTQVISFAAPNVWTDDAAERLRVCQAFNDGVADLAREHPGRFELFATLPLPHVDASLDETRRALDELEAVGFAVCTHFDGIPIDDPRFDPVYALLSEREATVLLHPEGFFVPGALADHGMEWAIGTPFDDTVAALRLIYGGVLDRHPGIRWIVPHLGGTIPFLAQRLDFIWRLNPRVRELLPAEPSSYLRRLWFDSANPDPRSIALAIDVFGADRLLYGSDFPFVARENLGFGLGRLALAGLDDAAHAAVRGGAATELLRLPRRVA